MPKVRIVVEHQIEQVTILDIPEDEFKDMTYEDALCNAPFDELQPSRICSDIVEITVDGEEHYF